MGPHFAVGDTCYSWSEDTKVYNPDGRENVAKDNEVSILRKEDISKAYFNCHTDIIQASVYIGNRRIIIGALKQNSIVSHILLIFFRKSTPVSL